MRGVDMREIKFRAWHNGRMVDMDELCRVIMGDYSALILDILGGDEPEASLMQFTGLKDKNGKEIYEGDIVRGEKREWYKSKICFGRVDIDELPEYQEEVKWDYELLDMRKNDYPRWWEVIGNIHQNPELIETV